MAANFTRLAATAKRLIESNGRTLTLRKKNRTPANTAQPWRGGADTPATATEGDSIDVIGVVLPASGSGFGREVFTDGSLAQEFTEVALIAASSVATGVELEEFGEVLDDSKNWRIKRVQTLQPGAIPLVHIVGLVA